MNDIELAKYLGYFSLGLGAFELVAGGRLAKALGLPAPDALVRAFGAREIGAGVAVLTFPDDPGPLWARVGGDVLDLAVLGAALMPSNRRRNAAVLATAAVLAVTALDVAVAVALTQRRSRAVRTARAARYVRPVAVSHAA